MIVLTQEHKSVYAIVPFEESTSGFTPGGRGLKMVKSTPLSRQAERQAGKRCMTDKIKVQRHRHLLVLGSSPKNCIPRQQNVQLSLLSLIVVHKEIATFRFLNTLNGTDDRKNTDSEKYLQE